MTTYLYDTHGNWIAHVPDGRNVWSRHGRWIGWFAYGDADVLTPKRKYLGTVVRNRLVHYMSHAYRGYPGHAGYSGHVPGTRDLREQDYDAST